MISPRSTAGSLSPRHSGQLTRTFDAFQIVGHRKFYDPLRDEKHAVSVCVDELPQVQNDQIDSKFGRV